MGKSAGTLPVLFRTEDFEAVVTKVSGSNTTSGLSLGKTPEPQLVEIGENALTLSLPRGSGQAGHPLSLELVAQYRDRRAVFRCTVRVTRVESAGIDTQRVQVALVQYEPAQWHAFRAVYACRQEELAELFARVKGAE